MAIQSNIARFKDELRALIDQGELLHLRLGLDLKIIKKEKLAQLKLPKFNENYERWYSLALQVLKQVLPDRLADFVSQYKIAQRKEITNSTYGISDHLSGLTITVTDAMGMGWTEVDGRVAYAKFLQQWNILKSAEARLESSVFDMSEVLQADLFDNELDEAFELAKKGFLRASGAVSGVVLERHLSHVCGKHNLKTRKKKPTINDLNQVL